MGKDQTAQRAESLGTERIFKLILQYALPAIAMMLISSLYNIVDKVFVGNFVGQIGITATTVAHPAMRFVDAFAMLVGAGGSTLLALRLGEGKSEEAEDILNNSFLLMLVLCAGLILLGYLFPVPLLRAFGAEDAVMPYALTYLRIVLCGSFFNATANSFGLFVRVDGSPKRMMLCSVTGCVLNIILDPLAIYVLNWGIAGAAVATAASQIVSGLMVIHYFTLSKRSTLKLRLSKLRLHWAITRKSTELGFSSFLQQFTGSLSQSILLSCLAIFATAQTVSGAVAQASVGITISIGLFFLLPAIGIASAIQPIIGYNYGAGEHKRVSQIYQIVLCMSGIIMVFGTVICLLIPGQLMGLFTHTKATIQAGETALRIIGAGFIVSAVSVTSSGALEGLGKGTPSLLISLCRYVVVIIPAAFLLSRFFGAVGVWNAFWITEAITAIISLVIYRKAITGP